MRELIYITDDLDSSSSFKQNKEKQNQPQGGAYITEMLKGAATNIMPTFANSTLARSLGFSILGVNPVSLVLALAVTSGPLVYILLKSKDKQLSAEEAKLIETDWVPNQLMLLKYHPLPLYKFLHLLDFSLNSRPYRAFRILIVLN